jgi:protein-S-isoprenylcysteine O-methyltransferase Ste14
VNPRRVNPPHYFLMALVAMVLLTGLPGGPLLPGPWAAVAVVAGVVSIVAGVALAMWAARQFARVGTNIVPLTPSSALVTDGAFAHTRNPMYTGMLLALGGVSLVANHAWPWIVLPVFYAVIRLHFIRHEERLMEATFGDAYRAYRARVGRFF